MVEGAAACAIVTSMFSIASSFRISRAGSQNADPVLPKPAISALVVDPPRFVVVRGTIDLDGQVRQCTVEIQNVGTYRVLPLESQSIQSATANPFPEQRFRQRHLAPQFARALSVSTGARIWILYDLLCSA